MPLQTHLKFGECTAGAAEGGVEGHGGTGADHTSTTYVPPNTGDNTGGGVEGHGGTGADHASSPHVPPNTAEDNGGGVEGCSGVYSAAHTGTPLHPSKHHAQQRQEVE